MTTSTLNHDTRPDTRPDTYDRLIDFLDGHGVSYSEIDHAPEGRTEEASLLRGHALAAAAKCMVVAVRSARQVVRHVLAVVPGDARVDFKKIRKLYGGSDASLAAPEDAERLSGCVVGTVIPFALDPGLDVVADPRLLRSRRLYFNAARADRSIGLDSLDYAMLAGARFAPVSTAPAATGVGVLAGVAVP